MHIYSVHTVVRIYFVLINSLHAIMWIVGWTSGHQSLQQMPLAGECSCQVSILYPAIIFSNIQINMVHMYIDIPHINKIVDLIILKAYLRH